MCCVYLAPWLKAQQQGVGFSVNTTAAVISATNLEARWDPHSHILLDPPDGIPKLVFLMAGPGLFNQDGNSVAWTVQITVTPSNGYKLKSPHSADPGTSVELTFRYTSEQSRLDIVSSTGKFLSDKLVFEKDEADTPLEIHVVPVILHEVEFEGTIPNLESDEGIEVMGITFDAPQWRDGNFDKLVNPGFVSGSFTDVKKDRCYPTAFVKFTKPNVNASCRLGNPLPAGIQLEMEAFPNKPGLEIPYRPLVVNGLDADFGGLVPVKEPLTNEIRCFDSGGTAFSDTFWVDWGIRMKPGGELPLQTSKHTIYQTLGSPILSSYGPRESLFFYACSGALGIHPATELAVVDGIYDLAFRPRWFQPVVPCRAIPDGTVTGIKFGSGDGYIPIMTAASCNTWAPFMVAMTRIHGLTGFKVLTVSTDGSLTYPGEGWPLNAWLVRERFFENKTSTTPPWSPIYYGQGHGNPTDEWLFHAIVGYCTATPPIRASVTNVYDPSYGAPSFGLGAFSDLNHYEWQGTGGYRWGMNFCWDLPASNEIKLDAVIP